MLFRSPEFTEIESKVVPVKKKKQEKIEDVDVRNFFKKNLKNSFTLTSLQHKLMNSSLITHLRINTITHRPKTITPKKSKPFDIKDLSPLARKDLVFRGFPKIEGWNKVAAGFLGCNLGVFMLWHTFGSSSTRNEKLMTT